MERKQLTIVRTSKFEFSKFNGAVGGKSVSTSNTTTGQTSNPTISFTCRVG